MFPLCPTKVRWDTGSFQTPIFDCPTKRPTKPTWGNFPDCIKFFKHRDKGSTVSGTRKITFIRSLWDTFSGFLSTPLGTKLSFFMLAGNGLPR